MTDAELRAHVSRLQKEHPDDDDPINGYWPSSVITAEQGKRTEKRRQERRLQENKNLRLRIKNTTDGKLQARLHQLQSSDAESKEIHIIIEETAKIASQFGKNKRIGETA